jgi:NADH-quinone oxidoreductase subunit C
MDFIDTISKAVRRNYPESFLSVERDGSLPAFFLEREWLVRILFLLRDDFDFESLSCQTASDRGDEIVLIYHLYSTRRRRMITVKTAVPKASPKVDTVEEVWRSATWYEREIYDLFGVEFIGHSDLVRVMLPPDWQGHPLLKDYRPAPEFHGMEIEW